MKEFKFKKKLKEGDLENNLQIIKENEKKEFNEFESSLKNLSEIEISNLKSKYEKEIFNSQMIIFLFVIIFTLVICHIVGKYLFDWPIVKNTKWYTELIILFFSMAGCSGVYNKPVSKKKLEIINKLNNEKVSI